jgi:hypothetical protein
MNSNFYSTEPDGLQRLVDDVIRALNVVRTAHNGHGTITLNVFSKQLTGYPRPAPYTRVTSTTRGPGKVTG